MPREYIHVSKYKNEILELKAQGLTMKEIGEKLGLNYKQIDNFFFRYKTNQQKLSSGIALKKNVRPYQKDGELPPSIQKLSKLTQRQYELACKDRYIKRLEMENELMRDFLSLAERK